MWKYVKLRVTQASTRVSCVAEDLECVWEKCSFKAADHGSLRQHVSFHGYLERLASVGAGLVDSMSLPVCALPPLAALPTQPPSYCCTWADCDACFLTYHAFLHHIKCHINCREDNYRCKWQGKLCLLKHLYLYLFQ